MTHCIGSLVRSRGGAIHGPVNQAMVNALPEHGCRKRNKRLYEHCTIQLIDAVFIQNEPVKPPCLLSQLARQVSPLVVKEPGSQESDRGSSNGYCAEHQLRTGVGGCGHRFGCGLKDWRKKMLKFCVTAHRLGNAYPSANKGENRQQNERNDHYHRAFMW